MRKAKMKERYPLLYDKKKLRKVAAKATDSLQLWGTQEDQEEFRKLITPSLFLDLLAYWLSNDGSALDWRKK